MSRSAEPDRQELGTIDGGCELGTEPGHQRRPCSCPVAVGDGGGVAAAEDIVTGELLGGYLGGLLGAIAPGGQGPDCGAAGRVEAADICAVGVARGRAGDGAGGGERSVDVSAVLILPTPPPARWRRKSSTRASASTLSAPARRRAGCSPRSWSTAVRIQSRRPVGSRWAGWASRRRSPRWWDSRCRTPRATCRGDVRGRRRPTFLSNFPPAIEGERDDADHPGTSPRAAGRVRPTRAPGLGVETSGPCRSRSSVARRPGRASPEASARRCPVP